jgi:hypothetical protein
MTSLTSYPCSAMPKLGTQAYIVLRMLVEGNHKTSALSIGLGGKSPRSALQSLMNKDYECWNIINNGIAGSNEGFYRLDPRHLSDDPELDKQARKERFLTLVKEKKDRNQKGADRLFESIEVWEEAESLFNSQLKLPFKKKK